jgi:hypothetical protein
MHKYPNASIKIFRAFCFLLFSIFNFQFSILNSSAQSLTGHVTEFSDEGFETPIPGAVLQWLNTSVGTVSDVNGYYILEKMNTTDQLVVKYTSYENDTITVKKEQTELNIILSSAHSLNAVNVVSREGSFISIKPIFTHVITGEGLRRAACCNLGESFESTIAVDVEYSDAVSGAKQISMLGLAGIYTQILLENVPYIRLLANQFGLGYVPGTWMEMISISKGTSSVTNGYEGITGQIQLDFKKPETNREKLFVNIFGNSMGKGELNLNSRFNIDKKKLVSGMFLLHGEGQFSKIDHNHDGFMDVPKNYQFNGMYRLDYMSYSRIFEGRTMIGYLFEDRIGGMNSFDPKKSIQELFKDNIWGMHIKTNKVDAITKNGFMINNSEFHSIGTILSFNFQKDVSQFGMRLYDAAQLSGYLNVIYTGRFGFMKNHKINAGASFQLDKVDETLTSFRFNEKYINHRADFVPGLFAEYAYSIAEKFIIMPGFRIDYYMDSLSSQLFLTPRLHLKWKPFEKTSIRASAGMGYRVSNPIIENLSLFVSNREFVFSESLSPEIAWNTGVSFVQNFNMPGGKSSFSIDYYYTHFINQTIIDLDIDPQIVLIYNLNGDANGKGNKSYSHSAQAEFVLMPFKRFEITLAYRFNDVRLTTARKLQQKALMSSNKALINLNYTLPYDKWKFNLTFQYNSPTRLPDMNNNPEKYRPVVNKNGKSPGWMMMNAQVTKKFRLWEIYIGGENMMNYKQKHPIISAENPFGEYFDASMIYMPITGIMGYVGVRVTLK